MSASGFGRIPWSEKDLVLILSLYASGVGRHLQISRMVYLPTWLLFLVMEAMCLISGASSMDLMNIINQYKEFQNSVFLIDIAGKVGIFQVCGMWKVVVVAK